MFKHCYRTTRRRSIHTYQERNKEMTSIKAGALDPEFGQDGKLEIRPPGNFYNNMSGVTTDASGRLLIYGGYARSGGENASELGAARLRNNGNFDTEFGQAGLTIKPKTVLASSANSLAFMADGSFFITGYSSSQLPIVRYNKDGQQPADWNLTPGQSNLSPRLLATTDDKLLVATRDLKGGALYRRNNNGSADDSFGDAGKITFLPDEIYIAILHMARSINTSSFYLAGETANDGFILRFKDNGELDATFADRGIYRFNLPDAILNACRRVIELSNGKILAIISSPGSEGGLVQLFCLTPAGELDSTFNGGKPLSVAGDVGEDIAVQQDGKLLVTHRGNITGQQLTRYLPDGLPDRSFGDDGTVTFTNHQISFLKGVTVQPDGKIVVAGAWGSITTLLRLLP
jgi:uncharacterized delta-60 repeat protein